MGARCKARGASARGTSAYTSRAGADNIRRWWGEQRAALAARCAASLSLSRWWWGGQSHSAGSQVRSHSHSHLLLGRPTYDVPPGARPGPPGRPAPAPSEPRAPPAACCPPAPFSRHCHRADFRSTSSAPVPLGHYFRPSERHPPEEAPEITPDT